MLGSMSAEIEAVVSDVLAMLGLPGASIVTLSRLAMDEHARRVSLALAAAESMTGLTREELTEWIASTPEVVPLAVRVLQAAGQSGNDRTLAILGECLGRCHDRPTNRPREELIVMAIEGLTEEHLTVLAACATGRKPTAEIAADLSGTIDATVVAMALMNMLSRGLFDNPFGGYGGGEYWGLSSLGAAVVDAAKAAYPTPVHD